MVTAAKGILVDQQFFEGFHLNSNCSWEHGQWKGVWRKDNNVILNGN